MKKEIAAFAMGCFWTPQRVFDKVEGVIATKVGYMGGKEDKKNYSYEEVCSGRTGHAETVYIEFDSGKIKYEDLLKIFWENHDPTQLNRQGPDSGTQYRSAIFYYSADQKKIAEKSMKKRQKEIPGKIVTEIKAAGKFYDAEEYHQKYLEKLGKESCRI